MSNRERLSPILSGLMLRVLDKIVDLCCYLEKVATGNKPKTIASACADEAELGSEIKTGNQYEDWEEKRYKPLAIPVLREPPPEHAIRRMRPRILDIPFPNNDRQLWDAEDKEYLQLILKPRLPAIKGKIRGAEDEVARIDRELDAALDTNDGGALGQIARRRRVAETRIQRLQKLVNLIEEP